MTDLARRRAIGRAIRDHRRLRNWSQRELAERIGRTARKVSAWERGVDQLDVLPLIDIADALGCSVADLLPEDS